jgi:hypothetical protein
MSWQKSLKVTWIVSCVAVLVWTLVSCGQQTEPTLRGECSLLAGGIMVLLTLPSGFLWMWLVSAVGYGLAVFGIETGSSSLISDFIVWLGFVGIGYFQWFKFVPWLIAKWLSRRTEASSSKRGTASE